MGLFSKISGGDKKREAFYAEYAVSHNLERSKQPLPGVTKNLEGNLRTKERFDGPLDTSYKGTIALVETTITSSVQMRTTDRDSEIQTWLPEGTETIGTETNSNTYPSTVVMVSLEKLNGVVAGLAVKGNFKKQSFSGDRNVYGSLGRISTEGLDLDDSFYVFADEGADPEQVRQLFSPGFSAWLNERPGKFFSFEVGDGTLVTKHGGKFPKDAETIDGYVAEACEIARRLEAEVPAG